VELRVLLGIVFSSVRSIAAAGGGQGVALLLHDPPRRDSLDPNLHIRQELRIRLEEIPPLVAEHGGEGLLAGILWTAVTEDLAVRRGEAQAVYPFVPLGVPPSPANLELLLLVARVEDHRVAPLSVPDQIERVDSFPDAQGAEEVRMAREGRETAGRGRRVQVPLGEVMVRTAVMRQRHTVFVVPSTEAGSQHRLRGGFDSGCVERRVHSGTRGRCDGGMS
jgi:hypothetical protein